MSALKNKRIAITLLAAPIALMLIYGAAVFWMSLKADGVAISDIAAFGDSFGVVTALFTALAFGGLILTVLLQGNELSLQRKELAETRFTNAFFKIIDYYKTNLQNITIRTADKSQLSGIDALIYQLSLFEKYQKESDIWYVKNSEKMKVYEYQLFVEVDRSLMRQYRYMSTLESLLHLVDSQVEDVSLKNIYWGIVGSQLTAHEVKYLFYRLLVEPTNSSLLSLVKRSGIVLNRAGKCGIPIKHTEIFRSIHGLDVGRARQKLPHRNLRKDIRNIRRKYQNK